MSHFATFQAKRAVYYQTKKISKVKRNVTMQMRQFGATFKLCALLPSFPTGVFLVRWPLTATTMLLPEVASSNRFSNVLLENRVK